MRVKGGSAFPKAPASLTIRLFSVISRTLVDRVTSLQRCGRCILPPPQPTGQQEVLKDFTIPIHEYVWNEHSMFIYIYIEHRISKHEKHLRLLCSGTTFLLPLSLKVLRHKERDTHSFYSGFSICPAISCGTHPSPTRASESQPSSPEAGLNSTQQTDFFKIPQILRACASGAWCHSHPLVNLSIGFLFWHLWITSSPRVRINTCTQVCTLLTHVLSRKVLSLTKPKGIKRNPSAIILQDDSRIMRSLTGRA